ncbi:hypothetical protein Tco_1152452 [Tanacetum coccineum]
MFGLTKSNIDTGPLFVGRDQYFSRFLPWVKRRTVAGILLLESLSEQPLQVQTDFAESFLGLGILQTCAHIHTTVSEVIKKVFIQSFRTISENQCLLQILKVTMIGRRDIIKAFKDSNRYEHVRLKISVWQSLSERRSQSNSEKKSLNKSKIKIKSSHLVLKIMIKVLKIELPKHIK